MNGREIASIKKRRVTPWLATSVVLGVITGTIASVPIHLIGWSADFSFVEFVDAYLTVWGERLIPIRFLWAAVGPKAREMLAAFPGWMGTFHSLIAAGCAGWGWFLRGMLAPKDDTIYIRGARLHDHRGNKSFAKKTAPKTKNTDRGIDFIPGVPFDQVRWFSHVSIFAGTGWGKSVWFYGLLNQIEKRKDDKLLLFDVKSEYLKCYPSFSLLDPLDARSLYWDIATDIQTEPEAENFFADLIPADGGGGADGEIWAKAAELVGAGMAIKLQTTKPFRWTWGGLYREMIRDGAAIRADLAVYAPEKLNALPEAAQTQSGVMFNIAGGPLSVIAAMAKAYALLERSADFERRKFSFKDWAKNDNPRHKKIILRKNGNMTSQSEAFIGAALGFYTKLIVSPNMGEKPKVWTFLVLDEFAQLPKIRSLQTVPAVGRGRKVAMIYGTQLISQVIERYGNEGAKTYTEIPQITVFGYLKGTDAKLAAEYIGTQDVSKPTVSTNAGGTGSSVSTSNQETPRSLVHPSQLSQLKPGEAFVTVNDDVFKVQFPENKREATGDAEVKWSHLKGGYKLAEQVFLAAKESHRTVRDVMACVQRANASIKAKEDRLTARDLMHLLVLHGMPDGVARTYRTWDMLMSKIGDMPLDAVLTQVKRDDYDLSVFLVDEREADELLDPSDASFLDDDGEETDEAVNEPNDRTADEAEATGEADQEDKPVNIGGKEAAMRLRGLLNQGREAA